MLCFLFLFYFIFGVSPTHWHTFRYTHAEHSFISHISRTNKVGPMTSLLVLVLHTHIVRRHITMHVYSSSRARLEDLISDSVGSLTQF